MSAHTPGPWTLIDPNGKVPYVECSHLMAVIGEIKGYRDEGNPGRYSLIPKEENRANAHLIAAAPELLAALRALVDDYKLLLGDGVEMGDDAALPLLRDADAAIAKAEGRP